MPWGVDWNKADLPYWLHGHNNAETLLAALLEMSKAPNAPLYASDYVRQRANEIKSRVYDPYVARVKAAGKATPNLQDWVREYWNWLYRGAVTNEQASRTVEGPNIGATGEGDLHYVSGVGYVPLSRLAELEPEQYQAYQDQKKAAEEAAGIDPYYEQYKSLVKQNYLQPTGHYGYIPRGVYGTKDFTGAMNSVGSIIKNTRYFTNVPTGGVTPAGAGPAYGAVAKSPANVPSKSVTINFNNQEANRAGNYAATRAPGQVSRTPAQTYYSGGYTGPDTEGYMLRARERAAKRVGRDISQAGVSSIPSYVTLNSLRNRWRNRRY